MATAVSDRLTQSLTERYDIVRELGRGGMARVYLAVDRKHDRQVAIKVLLPELTATVGVERFLREIRVVARLQHPHILPLYDSGEASGSLYFVMPFVDGESLRTRLVREGALGLEPATRILRQIADALDYAHVRGVVHRDLKPENILLAGDQALLADFGVARTVVETEGAAGDTLTSVGVTLGTPAYMSPEQAAAEPRVDARSDVYSLGCVFYEMLSGCAPFRGTSAMAVISQHITAPPPAVVGAKEPIPPAICDAVACALAKEPVGRFASAGDFAAAAERALTNARVPSPADIELRAVEEQHERRLRVFVLDFANIAGAQEADWLSTGIAETVSSDLQKVEGIKVVGQDAATRRRIDAMRGVGAIDSERAIEIGRSVGAQWIVWGGFQKIGPRVRIIPHFADTEQGRVVSAEKIDGNMEDIFALQDRIVTSMATVLRLQLTNAEVSRIQQPETTHLTAYEHYAKGYQAFLKLGKESVKSASEHFRAAIAADPKYALAYAGLGSLLIPLYIATGRREVLDEGARQLEQAINLDPSHGEAYAWLAYARFRQGRFDDAEHAGRRGIEREPSGYQSWYMLGCARMARAFTLHEPEHLARAAPPLLRSIALNPSFHPAHMALGCLYILRGGYGQAVRLIDDAVAVELSGIGMQFLGALVQRAVLHIGQGEEAQAAPLLDHAIQRYTGADHVYAETMNAYAHWARGCVAERAGALDAARDDFIRACDIADRNEHRLDIGAHWVKARFGLARVLYRLGRPEAVDALTEGRELFATRTRFVWTWFVGGNDPDVLYELAAACATMGRKDDMLEALRRAADAGWADITWLRHDPAFADVRDAAEVQRLCAYASSRVTLPPPVGSGGLS